MKLKKEYDILSPDQRLYHLGSPIIGLTGGIATGKSSVTTLLKDLGLPVVDADQLVKKIYMYPETIEFLQRSLPEVISSGIVDLKKLRELFFNDQQIKKKVEEHIYHYLPQAFNEKVISLSNPSFVIYDIPLLFEKGLEKYFDTTVLVYAPRELQLQRLIERDKITPDLANKILNQQLGIEDKKSRASWVIDNSSTRDHLNQQLKSLLNNLFY
jgi:dephospho-CoA kinase